MAEIPILHPAGISSDFGDRRIAFRIRVEDMMVRPIRNDSQRNPRRGLAHEHLRSQREHDTYNNTFHIHLPSAVRDARIRISQVPPV